MAPQGGIVGESMIELTTLPNFFRILAANGASDSSQIGVLSVYLVMPEH
jgi:hypothetical protein